jgi:hypothetical protein
MIAAQAARGIADCYDRRPVVPPRRLGEQPDVAAAVLHLEVEIGNGTVGQRHVAFRISIVVGVASGDRPDEDAVAAHRDLYLIVDLQPDVALPASHRNVVPVHPPHTKTSVRQGR